MNVLRIAYAVLLNFLRVACGFLLNFLCFLCTSYALVCTCINMSYEVFLVICISYALSKLYKK